MQIYSQGSGCGIEWKITNRNLVRYQGSVEEELDYKSKMEEEERDTKDKGILDKLALQDSLGKLGIAGQG